MSRSHAPRGTGGTRCPTCKQLAQRHENRWFPFCSERCKLLDLGQWLTERYRVVGEPAESAPDPAPPDGKPAGDNGPNYH